MWRERPLLIIKVRHDTLNASWSPSGRKIRAISLTSYCSLMSQWGEVTLPAQKGDVLPGHEISTYKISKEILLRYVWNYSPKQAYQERSDSSYKPRSYCCWITLAIFNSMPSHEGNTYCLCSWRAKTIFLPPMMLCEWIM